MLAGQTQNAVLLQQWVLLTGTEVKTITRRTPVHLPSLVHPSVEDLGELMVPLRGEVPGPPCWERSGFLTLR